MPEVAAYDAAAVRAAEKPLLAAGAPLMDRAAAALSEVVANETGPRDAVLVLAGGGDNGGDALLAAAALAESGRDVEIVLTGSGVHERGLARAVAAGAPTCSLEAALQAAEAGVFGVVIDGMVGIGGRGPLRGDAREAAVRLGPIVGSGSLAVFAVDLPSGLDADTGEADVRAVLPASVTVTFGAPKVGLGRGHGPALAGRIVLVDLGLDLDPAASSRRVVVDAFRRQRA